MAEFAALLGPWVAIVALLLGIVNTVAQWISRPGRELGKRIDELGQNTDAAIEVIEGIVTERFKDHDRRIQRLEDGLPHMPTKEDLHNLGLELAKLTERMGGLQHTVDRMDRHLRENNG